MKNKKDYKKIINWQATKTNNGEMTCKCGNNTFDYGFYPCNEQGEEIEPTNQNNWKNLYVCAKCGQILKDITKWESLENE